MGQKAMLQLWASVGIWDVKSADEKSIVIAISFKTWQEQGKEGWKMKILSEAPLVLATTTVPA